MLDKYVDIQHKRLGFHGVVLITKNNRELYRANIGKASIELDVPMNSGSVFKVASISKQFTAMQIMLAVDQVSVVILSNISVLPVNEIWSDIEKIIFNEPFELPEIKSTVKMTSEELNAFTGTYAGEGQELSILLMGDRLYAKLGSKPPFEIYAEGNYG